MESTKTSWKPSTLIGPIPPAIVTCGDMENSNIITIAWTGIINTIPPMTYISVRPERHSYDMIKNSGEFVINLPSKNIVKAIDWCGVRSGAKYDKFAEMNLTKEPVTHLSCPAIKESPLNLECRVKDIVKLGSHDMFIADIVGLNVEESLLDEKGKLCLDKANLVAFAHGEYFELGKSLGTFGYSVRKQDPKSNTKTPPKQATNQTNNKSNKQTSNKTKNQANNQNKTRTKNNSKNKSKNKKGGGKNVNKK